MDLARCYEFHTFQVARAQFEVLLRASSLDQQCGLQDRELIERTTEGLGFRFLEFKALHDGQLAVGSFYSKCGTQCSEKFFLGECIGVAVGLGPVDGAAVAPERRTDGADAGASRAFLPPELFAC